MEALPPGWRLNIHDSLPSTNAALIERARAGEPEGLAILARRQSAGRGTFGRAWESSAGNLHLSILLRPKLPRANPGAGALMLAVALADVVAEIAPEPARLSLKWPNDLLLGGRKLAGILSEVQMDDAGGIDWLVAGFGVNLAVAPPLAEGHAASLAETGIEPPSPEAFAVMLIASVLAWRARRASEGFAAIRTAWLARAHPVGTQLVIRQGRDAVAGAFAGLTDDGHLLLDSEGQRLALAAGEASPAIPE